MNRNRKRPAPNASGAYPTSTAGLPSRRFSASSPSRVEQRFRDLVDDLTDAILWEADPVTLQFTFVSRSAQALLGYPLEQWLTEPDFWTRHLHTADREAVVRACREVTFTGLYELEYRMTTAAGRTVWLRDRAHVVHDPDSGVRQLRGLMVDITARKQAERQIAAQFEVGRVLAEAPHLDQAAATILRIICQTLGWDLGALWLLDEATDSLRCHEIWHAPDIRAKDFVTVSHNMAIQRGEGLSGRVWASRQPDSIPDVGREPNFPRAPVATRCGLRGAAAFPVAVEGTVVAVMEFLSREVRHADEGLLQAMAALGSRIGQFIRRKRAEEALRASEEQNRTLVEMSPAVIYSIAPDGTFTALSPAFERITGWSASEWLGRSFAELVIPQDLPLATEMVRRAFQGETPPPFEIMVRAKSGEHLVGEIHIQPKVQDGKVVEVFGTGVDITERKRAEQALREALGVQRDLQERLSLLVEASTNLLGSLTLESMLPAIHDLSARLIAADAQAIWRRQENEWRIVAMAGLSEDYAGQRLEVVDESQAMPDVPFIVEDVEAISEPMLAERMDRYRQEGIRSLLVLPLKIRGENTGTLAFYYRQPHAFSDADIQVALALASLAASAIQTAELYEEQSHMRAEAEDARRRQAFLAEASVQLAVSSPDLSMTLAHLAHLAVPHLADVCAIDLLDDKGSVQRVALVHSDPSRVDAIRDIERRYPIDLDDSYGIGKVLRTGRSQFYPEIPDHLLENAALDEEHLRLLRGLGLRSGMCVPLTARGRTLGAITLATAEGGRLYTEKDLTFIEELGRRAALALDNVRLYEELQKANEAKDEFLGLVSHELRTPITAIYGGSRMLRSRGDRLGVDDREQIVGDIEEESEKLFRMVENLLALARIELGQQVATEPVLLQRAAEKLAASFRRRRPGRRLEITAEERLDPVAAQPTYLEQILRNLLNNADKYSPPQSPIELQVKRGQDGYAEILVLDRGPGIAPEETEAIFERFYRSGRTSSGVAGGGIGLTVCKRLIEAQSGRIWAKPREGGGLEVGMALPLYKDRDA